MATHNVPWALMNITYSHIELNEDLNDQHPQNKRSLLNIRFKLHATCRASNLMHGNG